MAEGRGILTTVSLTLRSLLWTFLLPGMVAGYVPWRYFGVSRARVEWRDPLHVVAVAAIACGAALLAACIWEFARSGRGTLSPVDPPRELVARGLYRYVRNPMYLAVTTVLLGELLLQPSRALLWYVAGWLVAVNVFVLAYEEPMLRSQFGESYDRYRSAVRRWLPSLRPRV